MGCTSRVHQHPFPFAGAGYSGVRPPSPDRQEPDGQVYIIFTGMAISHCRFWKLFICHNATKHSPKPKAPNTKHRQTHQNPLAHLLQSIHPTNHHSTCDLLICAVQATGSISKSQPSGRKGMKFTLWQQGPKGAMPSAAA